MKPSRFLLRHTQRKGVHILLLLCITYCGCSTSYIVTPTQGGGDYSYHDFNSEFSEKDAVIELKDGREMSAKQIQVKYDSKSWTESPSGTPYTVAANDVNAITKKNRLIGGLDGFGLGILAGGIYFGAVFFLNPGHEFKNANDAIPTLPLFPALGAVIGAAIGHGYEYRFRVDSTNAK